MIVIVNYGMGNLNSIQNMLKKIGVQSSISSNIYDIEKADKLILPGVGAFDSAMQNINKLGLLITLKNKAINEKVPILGICLGMQLLTKRSEEGNLPGLGLIDGETIRFQFNKNKINLKIPHMGWNTLIKRKESLLFNNLDNDARFYFVHSYHVACNNEEDVVAETNYGYDFISIFQHENIMGTQFHPEKSHKFGMKLLKNFVELN